MPGNHGRRSGHRGRRPQGLARLSADRLAARVMIRETMFDADSKVGMAVDGLSLKGSFQIIQLRLSDCPTLDLKR